MTMSAEHMVIQISRSHSSRSLLWEQQTRLQLAKLRVIMAASVEWSFVTYSESKAPLLHHGSGAHHCSNNER
jgi:hypothetical protein